MSHINIIYNRNLYKVPHLLYYGLRSGSASCAGYENVKLSRYQQMQKEVRTMNVFVANLIIVHHHCREICCKKIKNKRLINVGVKI